MTHNFLGNLFITYGITTFRLVDADHPQNGVHRYGRTLHRPAYHKFAQAYNNVLILEFNLDGIEYTWNND